MMSEQATEPAGLTKALAAAEIPTTPEQTAKLAEYCRLLWEWNEKINLTRHTSYARFVERDVVDTFHLAEVLNRRDRVLDVGSGGGVPGIVLAILRPDLKVTLTESTGKKARVLEDLVRRLELPITVHPGRAEELLGHKPFHALTVRAVARLAKLLTWFKPHFSTFDRLLVIKGPAWVEERGEARHLGLLRGLELRKRVEWPLPGGDSASVLLEIRKPVEAE